MDKIIKLLENLAQEEIAFEQDDFNADDYSGGNFDDAWQSGIDDGQRILAREILPTILEMYNKIKGSVV